MTAFRSVLVDRLRGGAQLTEFEILQLEQHYDLLTKWNEKINLTSVRELEDVVERHYCESVFLAQSLPCGPLAIADIGSGPGFPGFPIAVLRPECKVTLVESNGKKAVFLREATRCLSNVVVVQARAEFIEERFDWVVSRAVQWRQILKNVGAIAERLALLVGEGDAAELERVLPSAVAAPLPWGQHRTLVLGNVPRGTSVC
jgi:16S rRNA (guanine527-N7)-methyltransferase